MKRIIAILLMLFVVLSLSSCFETKDPIETEATEKETNETQGETAEQTEFETLVGKTPLEAHKEAVRFLSEIDNYELVIDYKSELDYGESPTKYSYVTSFKKNGTDLYYEYEENGEKLTEQYYVGGVIYYSNSGNKEKIEVTQEEYEQNMGEPVDGMLIALEDKYFDGIKFKKEIGGYGEELYVLNITILAEDYKKYTGVAVSEDATYDVYFSMDAKLVATRITTTQMVYGTFEVKDEVLNTLKNVGALDQISVPSDADSYRTPIAFDDIDLSTLESIENVSNSEEATDYVMISVKDKGDILIRLYEEVAPTTVANFKKLVGEGFYNGLIFHRVIEGFMIQGGCPDGNGTGGSGVDIYGEFAQNGFINNLSHKKGVVSMARSNDPDSASSQFFIMHKDNAGLDGAYAAFGFVVYGQDVVDAIATVETEENDKPVTDVVIESIRFVNIG